MRVTVPVATTARLLVALDRHAAERYLDLDGGLQEREWESDVERFLGQRRGFHDPVFDVHPRQLVVERDRGHDGGESLERTLRHEPHPDARELLTACANVLGLGDLELWRVLEIVAIAGRPQGAALATAGIDELVHSGPVGRFDALLVVGSGERPDRAAGGIELDLEATGACIERLAVGCGGPRLPIGFGQRHIAQGRHVAEQDEGVAVFEIDGREISALQGEGLTGASRDAGDVGALPRSGIEHQAAASRAGRSPEPQQAVAQQIAGRRGAGVDEAPLILPLGDGLA